MSFERLARGLTRRAANLAKARAEEHRRGRIGDERRWHRPGLLWPLFTTRID